jgi:hypothetical protein
LQLSPKGLLAELPALARKGAIRKCRVQRKERVNPASAGSSYTTGKHAVPSGIAAALPAGVLLQFGAFGGTSVEPALIGSYLMMMALVGSHAFNVAPVIASVVPGGAHLFRSRMASRIETCFVASSSAIKEWSPPHRCAASPPR